MKFILVGHGSIGSKYKDSILKKIPDINDLFIVDKNKELINKLRKDGLNCGETLDDLRTNEFTHGIVANWGPEHIKTANKLIDLGCKRLIIEKPLSCRKDELEIFKKRCLEDEVFVTIHHHWKYTNIFEVIDKSQNKYELGSPIGMRIIGGAVCLSTNGTHVFDLGCEILKSIPKSISADLELDYINPRNEKLVNIGGMASYKLQNNTFIHVSITNSNSEALRIEIIYKHGLLKLSTDSKLNVYKRKEEELIKFGGKITRYGDMQDLGEVIFNDKITVDEVLDNLINGSKPEVDINRAEIPVLMVLGALQSHLDQKRIMFDNIQDRGILIS